MPMTGVHNRIEEGQAKAAPLFRRSAPFACLSCEALAFLIKKVIEAMDQKLDKGLTHSLNTHGYSFQYVVLKLANLCFDNRTSPWAFEVSEFPVAINDYSTHIDFILRNKNEPFYFICECKRANPAVANWCFVKAPYVSRNISTGERIVREVIYIEPGNKTVQPKNCLDWIERSSEVYRLAFEVKSAGKGEATYGRGQISEATTQVLKGLNGTISFFVNYYKKNKQFPLGRYVNSFSRVAFMPVIFTTANLWVSDVDLSMADIENGNIDVSSVQLTQKEWLFYQHSQSPNIKHSFGNLGNSEGLSDLLYLDYTRTIPIINSSAIQSFFSQYFWNDPDDWNLGS